MAYLMRTWGADLRVLDNGVHRCSGVKRSAGEEKCCRPAQFRASAWYVTGRRGRQSQRTLFLCPVCVQKWAAWNRVSVPPYQEARPLLGLGREELLRILSEVPASMLEPDPEAFGGPDPEWYDDLSVDLEALPF